MEAGNIDQNSTIEQIWRTVGGILRPERLASSQMKIEVEGQVTDDPEILADSFNKFFKVKVEKLAAGISKNSGIDPLEQLKIKLKGSQHKFSLKTVSVDVVAGIAGFTGITGYL